ncbi:PAS domain S-box-containing protein [Pelomonas saccharophila]|uniref:histidine kinase n=1 Tax=Roseateles saccharophilus TaxID=304 RepID=A0ABU1YM97_ROSSA|nr:ATP-binding protein [Roseateles saccharophilus]MDR7269982.1 PAS domain S-box-containing protein [Roseateles saccharophilus]
MSQPAPRDFDTAFLAGGGELGALMRAHDWAATPLGEPTGWPRSLKTAVRIMLTSRQPIWIGWGPQLIKLYNDPYKSIIGGKHPWALGQPASTVWREIWPEIGPLLSSAMSGDGNFQESQQLIMERNGYPEETYYTYSYSPIPGDDGQPAGIICANSDETQRVIGERQLALLHELAARSADARTVVDAVYRCTRALETNRLDMPFALVLLRGHGEAAFELAGWAGGDGDWVGAAPGLSWPAGEVLALQQPRIVELPRGDIAWPCGDWKEAARQAMVLPIRPSGDTGREGVLVVGLNPYRLPEGRYTDFLRLVAQQLSAAIGNAEAYESQQQRAEELARLDRAKTQFFSNISHEFRTPLTLMMGPLRDALAHLQLPPSARGRLQMVERNALRLSKLVNALLEFSRIEAGRATSVFRPTDLAALTGELASSFRSAMEAAGLAFRVACPALPAPVYVDRDHWERILLNLLSNALKYTLQGEVSVRVGSEEGWAIVEVEDSGIGVAPQELPRLFERFHRVENVQARTHEGSGIGLALVHELMRLHQGRIEVSSQLGRGTRFTLRLPLGHAHLPPEHVRHEPAEILGGGQAMSYVQEALRWLPEEVVPEAMPSTAAMTDIGDRYRATLGSRIVIADDNADMRQYLRSLLAPYFRVEEAADGEEALAAVRRERPALLLSDVMMPRLDGFGVLAALRADDALHTLPVILLSARAGEEARIEGLGAGADDYLIKPFTARELLARVSALIELDLARRSGEQQLRLFLAHARMFTWEIELPARRLTVSENAVDVLGASLRNLDEGFALVHPDDVDEIRASIEAAARDGGGFTLEQRIVRPDNGEVRWLETRAQAMCNEAGEAVRLSGISFDMTERKRMEETLRESDRRKDEFLAMLAHELRNPLAPIRNAAELMLRTTQPGAPQRRAVEIIDRQVQQMTRMVDDLLDVSRVTHGRIEIEREPVGLRGVIAAAVEAVGPAMLERRHRLQVVSDLPLTVRGDAARLQQCLVNLLSNAAKYTDPGGEIRLELAREGDEAVMRVQDSGVGIAADMLPAVFDLFVQSARTLDRAEGGLGIGLSVVRRLVEMHGGRVAARSAGVGQGATFEMRLPLLLQPPVAAPLPADLPETPRRVLLIDDNEDAAESLAMMLRADGHEVRTGFGPQDALTLAAAWRPDVVLLDIGLPGMDGYEVARRLRAAPAGAPLRLVALTGYGQPEDIQRSAEAGFDGHLVKPVGLDALAKALRP